MSHDQLMSGTTGSGKSRAIDLQVAHLGIDWRGCMGAQFAWLAASLHRRTDLS